MRNVIIAVVALGLLSSWFPNFVLPAIEHGSMATAWDRWQEKKAKDAAARRAVEASNKAAREARAAAEARREQEWRERMAKAKIDADRRSYERWYGPKPVSVPKTEPLPFAPREPLKSGSAGSATAAVAPATAVPAPAPAPAPAPMPIENVSGPPVACTELARKNACRWGDAFAVAEMAERVCPSLKRTEVAQNAYRVFSGCPEFRACHARGVRKMEDTRPTTPDEIALFCVMASRPGPGALLERR